MEPRPVKYQGPSWSWAGINGPVCLHDCGNQFKSSNQLDSCVKVIDCRIQFRDTNSKLSDQFGAIESGALVLKGQLRKAKWVRHQNALRGGPLNVRPVRIRADAIEEDFVDANIKSIPVFLLTLALSKYVIKGLVLRKIGNDMYSRLGLFDCYESFHTDMFSKILDWLNDAECGMITIV